MNSYPIGHDNLITPFELPIEDIPYPLNCANPFNTVPHELGKMAAEQLQRTLTLPKSWIHNFGFDIESSEPIIGKMFGVLVVKDQNNNTGFISAFSGKMAGRYDIAGFVPPIYDSLASDGFLTAGMITLGKMIDQIKKLELENPEENKSKINSLKRQRSLHSSELQDQLFQHYLFINQYQEEKSLHDIFYDFLKIRPSSGAGDCALPKLLQYAFKQKLKPIAMAEFWWGLSPKSIYREHQSYYPACKEKCEPILQHMLKGIILD